MQEFTELVNKFGAAGFGIQMALILFGSYKGLWVWGREFRAMEQDRDRWMNVALRNLGIAEKSTQMRSSVTVE